ncbi:MAG: zinc peptidase from Grifola Frondosa [Podila humilis]|nr:MAG: zinc peptidase from Grifola Frondosa [Podila humilis]
MLSKYPLAPRYQVLGQQQMPLPFTKHGNTSPAPRATFRGCSADQQDQLNDAATGAQNLAASASSYINSHNSATPRYTTWFGSFTPERHSTVASHYTNIESNSFSSYIYDCTCTDPNETGYVYPDAFGEIYLCNPFWAASFTGSDSKVGALLGLASQFTVNAGTKNIAYGQQDCKQLATYDPNEAVMNEDSHKYFAENSPFLP